MDDLFPSDLERVSIRDAAREAGLAEAQAERLVDGLGISPEREGTVSADDVQLLRYVNAVLASGFPLVALLQLVRVYGQAMARITDAEVRLFHLYVHEPMMRAGTTGVETAEQMHAISREVLPLAGPVLESTSATCSTSSSRMVGHMEADLEAALSTSDGCGWRSRSPTWPATRG